MQGVTDKTIPNNQKSSFPNNDIKKKSNNKIGIKKSGFSFNKFIIFVE